MAELLQLSFLAVIQGLTEFLPISSSAHLLLPSLLLDWPDQGLVFDVAVHVGSLTAVTAYFRRDLMQLSSAWLDSLRGRSSERSWLAWYLLLATVPAGIAGLLLNDLVERYARSLLVIGTTSILFGLLLAVADLTGRRQLGLAGLTWKKALLIGLAQVLALIPGTSRSGITMTAALAVNLSREAAARFSFLLAIPIITASGLLAAAEFASIGAGVSDWLFLIWGALLSALVSWWCIGYFLRLIERVGFMPFVVYRVVLGLLLFAVYYA